jgi:hypothetical protein
MALADLNHRTRVIEILHTFSNTLFNITHEYNLLDICWTFALLKYLAGIAVNDADVCLPKQPL